MNSGTMSTIFPQGCAARSGSKCLFIALALALSLATVTLATAQTRVTIALAGSASPVERNAAKELVNHLHTLYPSTAFNVGTPSAAALVVYLGTSRDLPDRYASSIKSELTGPDSYAVKAIGNRVGVIAGASPRATLYAVDALLEKLDFGFYLSYNTAPQPTTLPFSLGGWELRDTPIVGERVIFDWHNFLSSCSTWNLVDWQHWITQASRMRFNAIMVHAYGNNPIYSFSFNGQTKPTGYLTNSRFGRDWGTEDVLDVRKIIGADGLFDGPIYGANASLVSDNERVQAAEGLMQRVFQFAASRGMGVTFALDVDTKEANPQNVIATLPPSARLTTNGFELVNPDTPEGYSYYRAEIAQLMKLYPEITQVAIWFRGGLNSPWRAIKPEEFPAAWRPEYRNALATNPHLLKDPDAPSMFAVSRIARAFRKALDETGHSDVTLTAGSWRFRYLPAADIFMPSGVTLMPLDYAYAFPSDPVEESLRAIGRHRPVVPIVWAQHDDRWFAGRSYTPFAGFGSILRWNNSAGYGVIHWTTRPMDLFFKNISDQVWTTSFDETLDGTASKMAKRTFGKNAQELGKRYLLDWIYDAPAFGRETSDTFLDQTIDVDNELSGRKLRLDLLSRVQPLVENAAERDWTGYYEIWEHYAADVYQAQSALQQSYSAQKIGNMELARREIAAAHPKIAIEEYARAIRQGRTSRGEKGILITLNLRWLPYFEAQRVALGLDPLQVEFAPTYHDPLAQGPGHYTFDFDVDHRPIEVLGKAELGADVGEFQADPQCPSGIEAGSPVTLSIGNLAGTPLPTGAYRMKLKMPLDARVEIESLGHQQEVTSASETDVQASDGKIHFTLSSRNHSVRVCGLALRSVNMLSPAT
jgi:hypothetical protein